ncbi:MULTISPECIES: hypothetical protein [unclassified Mesorhizobium]|nr:MULTISPECIES: hypothetical protein [unclassified Mesorhizobium]WFP62834.1 hypothetical protein QAZ47_31125 [Mesorhizobium sp. WSM4904]WFP76104.1 hypothetical protein QAZ22_31245 [Mesorhizobium sp. WSM4906]
MQTIGATLAGIRRQIYLALDIVVVDDGIEGRIGFDGLCQAQETV